MFGALFGFASIAAPLLGGYITEHLHWAWIFYINLPLGLIAFVLIAFYYRESAKHAKQKIDILGAILLVGAVVCLMFALELGGKQYAWNSPQILGLFAGFLLLAVLLVFVEKERPNRSSPTGCSETGCLRRAISSACWEVRRL